MDTDQIIFSPARRARRCILNLLVLSITVVGVYVGLHSDRSPFRGNGIVITSSDTALAYRPSSAPSEQASGSKDAPIQVSMKNSIASAYLVAPSSR
jgi:hypothetical protein